MPPRPSFSVQSILWAKSKWTRRNMPNIGMCW